MSKPAQIGLALQLYCQQYNALPADSEAGSLRKQLVKYIPDEEVFSVLATSPASRRQLSALLRHSRGTRRRATICFRLSTTPG